MGKKIIMKQGQIRLTSQEIAEIKHLSKKGWSSVKIGKKFGKCHQTVFFNLGRLKRKPGSNRIIGKKKAKTKKPKKQRYDGIGTNPSEIPDFIKKNLAERVAEKIKPKIKKGRCVICGGKKKDKKFRLTNFCSLKCFQNKI